MNTALNIRDVGFELKSALAERARQEGCSMADLATRLLHEALNITPETPAQRWKRENAAGLAAMEARAARVHELVKKASDYPLPSSENE